jgi:hypothetical protein
VKRLILGSAIAGLLELAAVGVLASDTSPTLVLPLRTIGVTQTTADVVRDLLAGEIENRGAPVMPANQLDADIAKGESACDDNECAAQAAAKYEAPRVVYGSLSRLGEKFIFRVRALRIDQDTPYYADQITSATEEDLDTVVRRAADGIVEGRSNAKSATIRTVTAQETFEPRRRAGRSSAGPRAGVILPIDQSYGGADRLTSLRLAFKYETNDSFIETTPMLGIAWRGEILDWTLFDLFAARILGVGDLAPYIGGGLGLHSVRMNQRAAGWNAPYYYGSYQTTTAFTGDVGLGLLLMRTFDYSIMLDVRYHYALSGDLYALGGRRAQGISLTFGTAH